MLLAKLPENHRYTLQTVMPESDGNVYFWIVSYNPKDENTQYYPHYSVCLDDNNPKTHDDHMWKVVQYLNKRLDRAEEYDRMIDRMIERHEEQEEYELMIKYGSER